MTSFPIRIPRCETSKDFPILFQYIYKVFKRNDSEVNTEFGCIHVQFIILSAAESEPYSTNMFSCVPTTPHLTFISVAILGTIPTAIYEKTGTEIDPIIKG